MDSLEVRQKRKSQLTSLQQSVIVGTILGDGHLLKTTCGYCLRLNHGLKQRALVDWKFKVLKNIATSPKIYKNSYYFRTVSHPVMTYYRKLFYEGKKKIVPNKLLKLINPISFAVWVMDDGTNELGTSRALRINTQCFTLEDQVKLQRVLRTKFGIRTTLNRDKSKYRIRIIKDDMPLIRSIIGKHTIPDMLYKIAP